MFRSELIFKKKIYLLYKVYKIVKILFGLIVFFGEKKIRILEKKLEKIKIKNFMNFK